LEDATLRDIGDLALGLVFVVGYLLFQEYSGRHSHAEPPGGVSIWSWALMVVVGAFFLIALTHPATVAKFCTIYKYLGLDYC
jgi:hypothetical protein